MSKHKRVTVIVLSIRTTNMFSDVELKIKDFLKNNLTDPLGAGRGARTPFVAVGTMLQRQIQYPLIVVSFLTTNATPFALNSNGLQHDIVVQVSVFSMNKKQLNEISDEMIETIRTNQETFKDWGLYYLRLNNVSRDYTENRVHARHFEFAFTYNQL